MKKYETYKPSGVAWLGDVPAHWEVKRLKFACSLYAQYGLNESAESYQNEGIRFLRTSDIDDFGNLSPEGVYLPEELTKGSELEDGDLLFSRSGTIGRSFLYSKNQHGRCSFAGYLVRFSPDKTLHQPFAFYFTKSTPYVEWLGQVAISATIGNVNGQKFASMPLPIPPLPEQRAIAAFLDRRTSHLDGLIGRKEELLKLLAEQRAALITRAVTQGLDAGVAKRDSGVPWLGLVPAHWGVKRLKFVTTKIGSGKTPRGGSDVYVSEGVIFLRSQNIHFDGLELSDVAFIEPAVDEEMSSTRVKAGDVLLNITGASLGRVAMAGPDLGSANVNQHVCILRPDPREVDSTFLWKFLASPIGQSQIFQNEQGISRDALNFDQISNLILAVPPMPEQLAIAAHLSDLEKPIIQLVEMIELHIARLREYRSALITAAVTGVVAVEGAAEVA